METLPEPSNGEQKKPEFTQTVQRPPSKDFNEEKPDWHDRPSNLAIRNRIYCTIWQISDTQEIELKTKKVKPHQDTFRYRNSEYNVILSHIQWKKAGLKSRRLTLNYKLNEPNPISYRKPSVYADGKIAQEIHNRKAYKSLLNKIETIVIIMLIAAFLTAAAGIGLYIYGQVTTRQEITKITAEKTALVNDNNLLKAKIEQLEARP